METPKRVLLPKNKLLENIATPLKIPASPLLEKLGFGTGVEVCRIKRTPNKDTIKSPWAVKRLTKYALKQGNNKLYKERLTKEAKLLKELSHPNVVGFRSFIVGKDGRDILALEDCNTSLGDLLWTRLENKMGPLPVNNIKKVCIDIASALDYLHTEALLLHGDIKSGNILVKNDFSICKLCDFGVSVPVTNEGYIDSVKEPTAAYIGTDVWSAPEVFEDQSLVGIKSDIFSFGLVIYEMIVLCPPHTLQMGKETDESYKSEEYSLEDSDIDIPFGTRPPLPESLELTSEYIKYVEMFYVCTSELPEDRPNAKTFFSFLE